MEIYTSMTDLTKRYPKIAVVLGTFDGVHLGHQKIISRAVELARIISGTSVVFTFSNHPLSIVAPNRCPKQITTPESKARIFASIGVDVLISIPFTNDFAKLSPDEFLNKLKQNLNPRFVVVGPNYTFGYKSTGTPELLKSVQRRYGFQAEVMSAFNINGNIVSSTLIRQLIARGKVSEAAKILGRPFKFEGKVTKGQQRGRILGYPTANLAILPDLVAPADGVYAVQAEVGESIYSGIANVGTNPTFRGLDRRVEVFLFNYKGELYGKKIGVEFFQYIRGEQQFDSVDKLVEQIRRDVDIVKEYFRDNYKVM